MKAKLLSTFSLLGLGLACGPLAGAAAATATSLISTGAVWKYLDTGVNQGAAWRAVNFNANVWSSGAARLGFGNDGEVTTIRRTNSLGATNITFYFRRQFTVTEPAAFTNLVVRLLSDDGGVVFLNEVEIFRSNMPAGAISFGTFASSVVTGAGEQLFFSTNVPAALLLPGTNQVAVEIHQANLTSPDAAFDLEMVGEGSGTTDILVALSSRAPGVISVPSSGAANPYPPQIQVLQNVPGVIGNVAVSLYGFEHARPADVDVLLVGPQWQKVVLMASAGGTSGISGVNLSFSPSAPAPLPEASPITSGVFLPTAYGAVGTFSDPAPPGPYTNTLADFYGHAPNGCWALYVRDHRSGANGSIVGGWGLTFTVQQLPPGIVVQPRSQIVAVGATARQHAVTSGTPRLHYQWLKDNVPIPGTDDPTLTIPNVALAADGNYRMSAVNDFGAAQSQEAHLTVLQPPVINVQPATRFSFVGQTNVTFSVEAGTGSLRYQWRRNGWNLPGETNKTLSIPLVAREHGGGYRVVVANAATAVVSTRADLILTNYDFVLTRDNFIGAGVPLQDSSRNPLHVVVRGTNQLATRQPGEPNHGGKPGGRSVWFTWQAPASGIATVQTLGSTFDTLLGVYAGSVVSNLATIAGDEDGWPFYPVSYTSRLQFNATASTPYHIAVDGFDGEQGHFVLSLDLEPTTERLPVVTLPPTNQTVTLGGKAAFGVAANGSGNRYQWFNHNANALIPGATNSQLVLPSVRPEDVGIYSVFVMNSSRMESRSARLEIGPLAGLVSEDKFPDLLGPRALPDPVPVYPTPCGPVNAGGNVFLSTQLGIVIPIIFLTAGVPVQFVFSSADTHPGADPMVCDAINETTVQSPPFQLVDPAGSARITVDTVGSTVPTVLQVFTATVVDGEVQPGDIVACDRDHTGPLGSSVVSFTANVGTAYCVEISAAPGRLHLNLHYGCEASAERVLSISGPELSPTEALLSWCAVPGTYRLQEIPSLTSSPAENVWTNEPTLPIVAGEVHYVGTPLEPVVRFFRLISRPP